MKKYILIFVILCCVSFVSAALVKPQNTTTLTDFWDCDEEGTNDSVNSINGLYNMTAIETGSHISGKFGNACNTNLTGGWGNTLSDTTNYFLNRSVYADFWINVHSYPVVAYSIIIGQADIIGGGGRSGWGVILQPNGIIGMITNSNAIYTYASTATVSLDTDTHVYLDYNRSWGKMYVNGVLVLNESIVDHTDTNTGDIFTFNGRAGNVAGMTKDTDEYIDDIAFYNESLLKGGTVTCDNTTNIGTGIGTIGWCYGGEDGVILISPISGTELDNVTASNVTFSFQANGNVFNISENVTCDLYIDGVFNQTNITTGENRTFAQFLNPIYHNWTVNCVQGVLNETADTKTFSIKTMPYNATYSWITLGGLTDNSLIFGQTMDNIYANFTVGSDWNKTLLTLTGPTSVVLDDVEMDCTLDGTDLTCNYPTNILLNQIGQYVINTSIFGFEELYNNSYGETAWNVTVINVDLGDGWYGYDTLKVCNESEIDTLLGWEYTIIESKLNASDINTSIYSDMKSIINYTGNANIRSAFTTYLDFDILNSTLRDVAKADIADRFDELNNPPYSEDVIYVALDSSLDYRSENIITWHSFDNNKTSGTTSIDSADNFNGTLVGSPIENISCMYAECYNFVPNDYVDLGDSADFRPGNAPFSLSAWLRPDDITLISIAGTYDTRVGFEGFTWSYKSTGVYSIYIDGAYYDTSITPTLNEWEHVVYTNNGASNGKWYINGNFTEQTSGQDLDAGYSLHIGRGGPSSINYYDGDIDEFAMWDVELNATEILALYNEGVGKTYDNDIGRPFREEDVADAYNDIAESIVVATSNNFPVLAKNLTSDYFDSAYIETSDMNYVTAVNESVLVDEEYGLFNTTISLNRIYYDLNSTLKTQAQTYQNNIMLNLRALPSVSTCSNDYCFLANGDAVMFNNGGSDANKTFTG